MNSCTDICPYLATFDDRDTACGYPTISNACYRTDPPSQVLLGKQEACCLTDRYRGCARYMGRVNPPEATKRRPKLVPARVWAMFF